MNKPNEAENATSKPIQSEEQRGIRARSVVAQFFDSLASDQLLRRLKVVALRLLGCETAVSPGGRRTLRLLAATFHMPVFGPTKPLMKSHYDEFGFNPAFAHILVEAAELV